jgi:hypothetical protein
MRNLESIETTHHVEPIRITRITSLGRPDIKEGRPGNVLAGFLSQVTTPRVLPEVTHEVPLFSR